MYRCSRCKVPTNNHCDYKRNLYPVHYCNDCDHKRKKDVCEFLNNNPNILEEFTNKNNGKIIFKIVI
jgi:hypothetical protein